MQFQEPLSKKMWESEDEHTFFNYLRIFLEREALKHLAVFRANFWFSVQGSFLVVLAGGTYHARDKTSLLHASQAHQLLSTPINKVWPKKQINSQE